MKYTIRMRLFVIMTGLIVFFVFLSWLLNDRLLEKYYLYDKKNNLVKTYHTINDLFNEAAADLELKLEKLENIKGIRIVVRDRDFKPIYDSMFGSEVPRYNASNRLPRRNILLAFKSRIDRLIKDKGIWIGVYKDSRLNTEFINLAARLDNGHYLMLTTPNAVIKDSVAIANRFFMFTGFFTILVGSFLVFMLSGKFIKPILDLKELAQKMAGLDFSRKYSGGTGDELDDLGQSINSLSEQLETSISELRAANEKLQQDIERERKIDEMRKEFISNVSHELKTPIALIQGYAEGLKMNIIEDEQSRNFYCEVIADEAAKMNRLVKQLLDLARIESGNVPVERVNFNISALLQKALKKNELLFKEKEVRVETKIDPDLFVNADHDLSEQIINNYLSNALNHLEKPNLIKIRTASLNGKIRTSVFNTGKHIPEEDLERIWISFYKIDKARTREYGGTGLGLSIVRAIQEAHGNSYGCANVEGGVEFWFELDEAANGDGALNIQ